MRKVLSSNREVAHYFANNVQSEGSASNFYFVGDKLYSYGKHFCVARRLPSGLFAFTTRTYGNSTSKHLNYARAALSHRTLVYCNDPAETAQYNKRMAEQSINGAMADSEKPRIRQSTRDANKARALYLAEKFNAYLAALPDDERANVTMFDTSGLEDMRAAMLREEERKAQAEQARIEAAQVEAREYRSDWRTDTTMRTQGMGSLPPALRYVAHDHVIQTSHGAAIPEADARAIWPLIQAVKTGAVTGEFATKALRRLGVYTLTEIRADGSIIVGCHDIAWSEINLMAHILGLVGDEVQA